MLQVLFEFGLIFGNERVRSVAENMKKFALALENVMASDKLDNEVCIFHSVLFLLNN